MQPGGTQVSRTNRDSTTTQQAALRDMVWSIAEMLAELSRLFRLRAGDLVFTGTPEGVAALHRGDRFVAGLDGEELLSGRIV